VGELKSTSAFGTDIRSPHEDTLWCSFCGRTTYFLLRGSLLTVSTMSRVVVIHINQPQAAGTDVNFFFFFFSTAEDGYSWTFYVLHCWWRDHIRSHYLKEDCEERMMV
jgi:hypothetical protein